MTRNDLIDLVEEVMRGAGTEEEHDVLVHTLERNVPHPRVVELIYYTDPPLTAAEVVDEALAHRPIEL